MEKPDNQYGQISTISKEVFNSKSILVDNNHQQKIQIEPEYNHEKNNYNPHENRELDHPNSYVGAFIHLVKSSLGTGILAVPRAFKCAGLLVGAIGTILIGILCTHSIYILVQASQKVCTKAKLPSLGFADTAEQVFKQGPVRIRKYSTIAKTFVEIALMSTYYLGTAVYIVFITVSLKKLFAVHYPDTIWWDKYIYQLIIMTPLLFLCQIREIKHMVPFSFIANTMLAVAFGITGYYVFVEIEDIPMSNRTLAAGPSGIPPFLSTVLFAMEGIGTIMPVENSMIEPTFLGWTGVLNTSMLVIIFLFTSIGFFGYLRYGEETEVTITKNLPDNDKLAQIVQAAISISVFFTFMLVFFVPVDVAWRKIRDKIPKSRHNISQILLRIIMLILVTGIAIAGGEHLAGLIDLIGAIFFSSLGFLIPAILDIIVNWEEDWGIFYWKFIKNICIILVALFALVCGSFYAIKEIVK